jgi:hypothetical protein
MQVEFFPHCLWYFSAGNKQLSNLLYYVSNGLVFKEKFKALVEVIITVVSRQRCIVLFFFVFLSENRKTNF